MNRSRHASPWAWALFAAVALVLVVGVVVPVLAVARAGLSPAWIGEVLRHPLQREGLATSFAVALVTTLISLGIALPLALIGWRLRFRGQGVAEALLLAPLILPPFVGALGVFQLLGVHGVVNSAGTALGWWPPGHGPDWLGDHRFAVVCVIEALHLYPFLWLALAAAAARLDPGLIEAAAACGASRLTILRRIVLPLLKPGLFAGITVIFVWSFTELGTPLMLGFDRVVPVQIFNGLTELNTNHQPFALVVVMLVVVAVCYGLARLLAGRQPDAVVVKGAAQSAGRRVHGWRAALAWMPYLLVTGFAVAPHLMVLALACGHDWHGTLLPASVTLDRFRDALAHRDVVPSISNSVGYAGLATILALIIGFAVAWITARWKPRGAAALDVLAMAPLAVPGLIMAFGFLAIGVWLGQQIPALKPWLDPFANPGPLLIFAYAIRRLPQVVRATHAGLAQAPPALEEAAAACGANAWTRLRRITLPLIAASLAAGAILCFSFSMLEVSDSLILAQKRDAWPVTKVLYDLSSVLGSGPAVACAFAVWTMAFLAASLCTAAILTGRSLTRMLRE